MAVTWSTHPHRLEASSGSFGVSLGHDERKCPRGQWGKIGNRLRLQINTVVKVTECICVHVCGRVTEGTSGEVSQMWIFSLLRSLSLSFILSVSCVIYILSLRLCAKSKLQLFGNHLCKSCQLCQNKYVVNYTSTRKSQSVLSFLLF